MKMNLKSERGTAILETALTLPLLLLVSVGIFEFGRAYQTWQVLTNAAREGARIAVLPNVAAGDPEARVRQYMTSGQLPSDAVASAGVAVTAGSVDIGGSAQPTSIVTVTYPFNFMVLQPVARLVVSGSQLGSAVTLTARAEMRNEQ
ncbi:MAG TPA: TadE family protein [Vicinamibacterales bacterium]|nr:TadE family protein [Vicinamibacterales bacterium]